MFVGCDVDPLGGPLGLSGAVWILLPPQLRMTGPSKATAEMVSHHRTSGSEAVDP